MELPNTKMIGGSLKAMCVVSAMVVILGSQVQAARCPHACLSGVCDDVTGNCVVDWGSGEIGATGAPQGPVKIGCPVGYYGDVCSQICPAACKNGACDKVTGNCIEGCITGYKGTDCSTDCTEGYYGENCVLSCSGNCKNGTCNPKSGVCLGGCRNGFWGSDCTLGVELSRRNAAEDQRKLYAHLSAEGKSILLFLLTPQYERALARAQFEIETALQFRNTIQHMLN